MRVERNPGLTRQLRQIIEEECALQKAYLEVLLEERKRLGRMQDKEAPEQLSMLTLRREALASEMKRLAEQRAGLLTAFPEAETKKLSEIVTECFHRADAAELMPHINRLKSLVAKSRRSGLEFTQIVDFSLNLVNGLVSLFMSATQSVVRSYSQSGRIRERYAPGSSGGPGVLKEA